jgi:hypothetical protein
VEDEEANDKRMAAISLAASVGGGLLLSQVTSLGIDKALPPAVQQWSSALGWSYVLAWSISFYPQVRQQGWQAARVTGVVDTKTTNAAVVVLLAGCDALRATCMRFQYKQCSHTASAVSALAVGCVDDTQQPHTQQRTPCPSSVLLHHRAA